ncbi:hypothetical protein ONZ51_g11233 [Trametes cubensis]|uniref:HNH nuclease domain-containing protein n=1 Tax=Trametes cubensis TaxID=1111947 RepID=A0AAD7THY4_9APHY|nr:hypothetical protein ONZ51_g11233 [Trametes cubensis]
MMAGAQSPPDGTYCAYTKVAHIISQPLTDAIGGLSQSAREKFSWASSIAAVLERFGGDNIREVMPLWLTPAMDDHQCIIPNTYNVVFRDAIEARICSHIKRQVQFREVTTPDGQLVRPPSRALLELHAACAKIAHLSGAGELLDDIYQEEGPMNGVPLSLPNMTVYTPAADYLQRALTRAALAERLE